MKNKEKYYKAFQENNGVLDEISQGEKIGFDESITVSLRDCGKKSRLNNNYRKL